MSETTLHLETRKERRSAKAMGKLAMAARSPVRVNTCPASRHVHMMADALATGEKFHPFDEEPFHCAESLYSVITSLWKARDRIAELEAALSDSPDIPERSSK